MTTRRVLARPGSRFAGRAGAVALTTAVVVSVVVGWATPASAASYRYWSYWHGTSTGGWTFSQVGAQFQPAAGSVDGWRFAVSGTAGSVKPRAAASFGAICGSHAPAPAGQKLVGLVVDYGTTADAPPRQHPPRGVDTYCAQVGTHGTSAQVLVAYASVRSDSGLVCAVDGYPANECGVIVTPTPKPTPTKSSPKPSHSTSTPGATTGSTATHPGGASSSTAPVPSTPTSTGPSGAASTSTSGDPSQDPVPVAVGSGGISDPPSGGTTTPVGALAGAGLVLVVGAAALVRARRGRTPPGGDRV